jgi:hypothetical protein
MFVVDVVDEFDRNLSDNDDGLVFVLIDGLLMI